jgi:DNA-binding response OmpR family regulator
MSRENILIVDEDVQRRRVNTFGLRCAGFVILEAPDPSEALALMAQRCPDLVLVAVELLQFWIQDLVQSIRADARKQDVPVAVLVERAAEGSAATALQWGITDYLCEPITPEAFVERLRAALRARTSRWTGAALPELSVDEATGRLWRGDSFVPLGPVERRLMTLFLDRPGELLPRDLLLYRVWGDAQPVRSRVLDVCVCRLRTALSKLGCDRLIHTVSRHGYRFASSPRNALASSELPSRLAHW